MNAFVVALFLVIVNERIIGAFFQPIFDKFKLDKFWLTYIAWITGGLLVWFSGINLFSEYLPNVLFGQILSAVVAGGGSNLLHDLFDKKQ